MQIITGKYRARKLVSPEVHSTRPTLARVKESVFNLIAYEISGRVVLDLFAGSGAFGAECISRGASKVYFVDKEMPAINAIKTNTKGMTEDYEIIKADFTDAIVGFSKNGVKFGLIYIDPPYDSDFAVKSLELIKKYDLIEKDGTIVVEHKYQNDLQNLENYYIIKKTKKYGIAFVDVLGVKGE